MCPSRFGRGVAVPVVAGNGKGTAGVVRTDWLAPVGADGRRISCGDTRGCPGNPPDGRFSRPFMTVVCGTVPEALAGGFAARSV